MTHSDLTPEEESLLKRFASRQHESEDAESRLVEKYGNRAALAKQVWSAILAIIGAAVIGTAYMLSIKQDVERGIRDNAQARADINRNSDRIEEVRKSVESLRLEVVKKVDRKPDF